MVSSSLEQLKESHEVTIRWRSFELRPKDGPPPSPEYVAKIKAFRPQLYTIAKEQYGLELNDGPFGINSRPALIGAKFAEANGVGEAYHQAVFEAYWLSGQSIAEEDVLVDIASKIGLNTTEFQTALQNQTWETIVLNDVQQAHAFGINSVPAMLFANKYLLTGAQPYKVLVDVVNQIQAELG